MNATYRIELWDEELRPIPGCDEYHGGWSGKLARRCLHHRNTGLGPRRLRMALRRLLAMGWDWDASILVTREDSTPGKSRPA